MRTRPRLVLALAILAPAAPAADDPAPLLKPVVPAGTGVRVRVPVGPANRYTDSQVAARVPRAKTGEPIDVTVALDTLPGRGAVSAKKWKSWGYEVPANRVAKLPEVVLPAAQLAPKPPNGDVEVKFPAVALDIVDPPGDSGLVYGCDLYLRLTDLTRGAERTSEPRFHFGEKFLELTAARGAVRRLDTGARSPTEPEARSDAKLVPVSGPMAVRSVPVFAFASVNGVSRYKMPDGKFQAVDVGVSSNLNWPGGIMMTLGAARGCGVEFADGADGTGVGAGFETMLARGKVKEFRLGFRTGAAFDHPKDLVLKDVTVAVDRTHSGHFVWLGTKFITEHLADAVYACGPDNAWKLVGRVKPGLLQDVKTRTPAKE